MTVDRWLALPLDAIVAGFQSMMFCVFAKICGVRERIAPPDPWFRSLMSVVTLEAGLVVGRDAAAGRAWPLGLPAPGVQNGLPCCRTRKRCGRHRAEHPILLGFQLIHSAFLVSILESRASRPTEGTVADRSAEAA
jgi:hypothetical protein